MFHQVLPSSGQVRPMKIGNVTIRMRGTGLVDGASGWSISGGMGGRRGNIVQGVRVAGTGQVRADPIIFL
jgi:hypothetical protein